VSFHVDISVAGVFINAESDGQYLKYESTCHSVMSLITVLITLPPGGVQSIVMKSVCLSICLFVCPLKNYIANLHQFFFFMLRVAMAWSCSDGVAIRSVLPVLWMTLRFHRMGPMSQNQA